MKRLWPVLIGFSIFAVLIGLQVRRELSYAPNALQSNLYSLKDLNHILDDLKVFQEEHSKIIKSFNDLTPLEQVKTSGVKNLVPQDYEIFLIELPLEKKDNNPLSQWERAFSRIGNLKLRSNGNETYGQSQVIKKVPEGLLVTLLFYIKTDYHHYYLEAKKSLKTKSKAFQVTNNFPEDNEYFVPVNRALKYGDQFIEYHQDKSIENNRQVQFYKDKENKLYFNFSLLLFFAFTSLLYTVLTPIRYLKKEKSLLKKGIIKRTNVFYDQLMEFKKSVLEKDAELKEIQNKLHRVETLKIESNSKVAGLEKYKKELEIEKNRFEKISLEKVNLLSFVGHDLRAPLSNILSTTRLLDKKISPDQMPKLEIIKKNAEDGLDLISGLLKSGGKKTGEENFKLDILAEECISICDEISNDKNINISFDCQLRPLFVCAQRLQIKQMLLNLLRNGVKYSFKNTKIKVSLSKHSVLPRNIILSVKDEGPGIPKNELENIFKSYYRLDRDTKKEGSGVGLSFCRQICHQHGGTINAYSDGQNGTTFEISLPIFIGEEKITDQKLIQSNDAMSTINDNEIIIVEDNQETANVMVERLREVTNSIHVYQNGDHFIRKLNLYPDLLRLTKLIILDFEIPGTKGIELINKIELFTQQRQIPIVFFTGNVKSIGTAAFAKVSKVFDKKTEFRDLICYADQLFDSGKAKNVLVIDDSEDIHYLLDVFFEDGPILVNPVYVDTIEKGLQLVRENHEFWDIIFSDLNIGKEKGEDFLFSLGKENIKGKIKVIAMSAMIDEPKRLELISLGFNEAISKNFDQAIINSLLKY